MFVKPNALGSSIGISKVKRAADLKAALDDAFQYDRKVLIEAACEGREFECAVLGNDRPEASIPGEVIVKGAHEFYSYESKYVDPDGAGDKNSRRPAAGQGEQVARDGGGGVQGAVAARDGAGRFPRAAATCSEIYVNEVNTIPGFTAISMYPKLWEASGLPLPRLIDRLIELALEEHRERAALKITYQPKSLPKPRD